MLLVGRNIARFGRIASSLRGRKRNGLFVVPTTAAPAIFWRWLLTVGTRRNDVVRTGSWRSRTTWYNPELHGQIRPTATVDCCQPSSIDTARINKVILRAIRSCLCLTRTGAVGDYVALAAWRVLQLNSIVVETGLLIVELDVPILVKLGRYRRRRLYASRAHPCLRAGRIQSAHINCRRHGLASQSSRIDCDGGGTLTAADSSSRN